ncbi:FxDxF family PEP-CTERM protein [Herbaspirillum camelliae]|uniref:FxDxF family PEP-CTERM protein n=1 Tax=Herbaspirillum camelliae TaxID=1892903 RepID=UPI000949D96F|nr:FxDxF family PEP-CTERM protein [Herbaspirillum camelliae]
MKKLIGGVLLASALCSVGATASAAQINGTQALTFNNSSTTSSYFGSEFGAGTTGKSFLENFTFSYSSPFTVSSAVISIALDGISRLNLNSLTLSGNGGTWTGVKTTVGSAQVFTLRTDGLSSGNYTLSVGGLVTGATGGSFGGNISIAAVPEASTVAMMLGGLALVGFAAYRRRRTEGNAQSQDRLMPA